MKNIPILILHGWNLSSAKYKPLQRELENKGYMVLSIDLPSFGKANPLIHPYDIQDYGKYIIDYLNKKNIKKIIIIGHSFGGRIGIYLSLNYSKLIEALILSGTPGLGADLTSKEKIYLFMAKLGKVIFSMPILSIFADMARKFMYKLVGSYDYYKTSGVLRKTFQNIVGYRLEPLLDKINIPTLIIWGQSDKIVPVKVAYGMNKLIKNSRLVIINDSRHGVPWTHPKEFADEVEKFLKKL